MVTANDSTRATRDQGTALDVSSTPVCRPTTTTARARRAKIDLWMRRLHYYLGLYFLLFIWLFAVSGLLLNHPQWSIRRLGPERQETTFERSFTRPAVAGDVAVARALLRELGMSGEIGQITTATETDTLVVQMNRPGRNYTITADLAAGRATVRQIEAPVAGLADALHTFTGVRMDNAALQRDWLLTTVWALSMDAVAAGLVLMVLSGLYMWYLRPARRRAGLLALALGTLTCAFFLVGLARIL